MKRNWMLLILTVVFLVGLTGNILAETITYLTPETDPTAVEVDKTIIERFEKMNPGVKVELAHADLENLLPKLSAMLLAGTAPDVAFCSPMYVPPLVEQEFLEPLDYLFIDIGDIPKNMVTPNSENKIYDIPLAMESRPLYYRKDLFEEAGVKPPTTFDEWLEAARKLTVDTDGDGNIDQYGMTLRGMPPGNVGAFNAFLWSNNGDLIDEEGNVVIDSPEAIETLEFWGKMSKYCPPGVTNTSYHDMLVNFAQGTTAMAIAPGRLMANIDRYKPELRDKIGIVAPPVGPSGEKPAIWTPINNFIVFKNGNESLAKKFIEFYLSDEQYILFLTSAVPGHSLPTRQDWLDKDIYYSQETISKWEPIVKKSLKLAFDYSIDLMLRYKGNQYIGRFMSDPTYSREINMFLSGDKSAEEALNTVAETWREMME
ncbi:MAG: sugar ABC transporter substrate-binding protein [Firmicutes bacterium]|nr:sugar ABC transporter substrate-binding protein [Bacillota bacterium]